ncbi:MAG: efflux RND transporter periplasmic adaptor subunit [Bacteroidales bacterium]|nr:efflux RND transporter periplasmic adaptor subunit [Bacteroidales bacterium]
MKRLIIISAIILVLVGACTVTLLYNKQQIDKKANPDITISRIPVFVEESVIQPLDGDFSYQGSFQPVHELLLLSEGQGKVERLLFETGDEVQAGQLLATLDDDLLRSQLTLAEANLAKMERDLAKYESLLKNDAISSQQVEDARLGLVKAQTDVVTLKKQLDYASVKAPIRGTITDRKIEIGSVLMPGSPVAQIVDISRLRFIAYMSESEAVSVHRGDRMMITSSLFPGITYQGEVISVGVKADAAKRFPVEIDVENKRDHTLKAGMFGTAFFKGVNKRQAMVIPRNALTGSIKEPKVFVVKEDTAFLKEISLGMADDNLVEVTHGLNLGDRVVVSGQMNLEDGSVVTVVTQPSDESLTLTQPK